MVDVRLFFILAARIAFWVFVHCMIKIENFASYTSIKFAALLAPLAAIIVTCQIFLHYNK
jgi:hypothetical protein